MEEYIIEELKKLSNKAYKNGEVPVGCVIVKDNKIIAKAYNKRETKKNPILHAEIMAIIKACKKEKNWRLDDCQMYVTLEPCNMCKEIIKETRINKVVYILKSKVSKKTLTKYKKCDIQDEYFEKKLLSFFKQKR